MHNFSKNFRKWGWSQLNDISAQKAEKLENDPLILQLSTVKYVKHNSEIPLKEFIF